MTRPRPKLPKAYGVTVATRTGDKEGSYKFWYDPNNSLNQAVQKKGKTDGDYIVEVDGDKVDPIFRWSPQRKGWVQLWAVLPARERVNAVLTETDDPDELIEALVAAIEDGETRLWQWAKWTVVDVLLRHLSGNEKFKIIADDMRTNFDRLNPTKRPPWEG